MRTSINAHRQFGKRRLHGVVVAVAAQVDELIMCHVRPSSSE